MGDWYVGRSKKGKDRVAKDEGNTEHQRNRERSERNAEERRSRKAKEEEKKRKCMWLVGRKADGGRKGRQRKEGKKNKRNIVKEEKGKLREGEEEGEKEVYGAVKSEG